MTARNLKVEDVTAVATVSNGAGSIYGTQPYSYSGTAPYIWYNNERSSWSSAVNNRSTAYSLTTGTTTSISGVSPWYSYWYNTSMNTSSAWTNSTYYDMVMTPAQSKAYWLSSRYVYLASGYCRFGLQGMTSYGVRGDYLYHSDGYTDDFSRAVRPLVSIPLTSCVISTSTDSNYSYHITNT